MKSRSLRQGLAEDPIPPWTVLVDTETVDVGQGQQRLLLGCYEVWRVSERTGIPRGDQAAFQQRGEPFRRGHFTHEGELYQLLRGLGQCRAVAHNWQFDASVIRLGSSETRRQYGYIIDMERCTFPIDKGYTPFSVYISWGGDSYTHFICNTNFHKTSLAKLGESFGIAKLTMPTLDPSLLDQTDRLDYPALDHMDSNVMGQMGYTGILEVLRYCRRDVEVLREAWFSLFRFSDDMAGCTPGITVASMSLRLYRRRWLSAVKKRGEKIIGSLAHPEVADAEEQAYRGGRTDVFYEGTPKPGLTLRKYDVVSMYPSVMLGRMPVEYLEPARPDAMIKGLKGGDGRLYLAKVTANVPSDGLGWIGWEGQKIRGRGLVFGAGKWTTWVWQPMVAIALDQGWIDEIHEVFAYRAVSMFRQFVEDIYGLRAEAKRQQDGPKSLLLKYTLNSLYGKFGQGRFGEWVRLSPKDPDYDWQKRSRGEEGWDRWQDYPCGDMGQPLADYLLAEDGIYRYLPGEEGMGENSVCSIAGYVTTAARAKLWRALAMLRAANHGIYMVDTDSIITDGLLPPQVCGDALGQWQLEQESLSEECRFNAPKDYTFAGAAKCKGIRQPEPDRRDYEQIRFSRWQTQLMSRHSEVREQLERGAIVSTIAKHVTGTNHKRLSRGPDAFNDPLVWDGTPT